jgi:hypothetical protein
MKDIPLTFALLVLAKCRSLDLCLAGSSTSSEKSPLSLIFFPTMRKKVRGEGFAE